MSSILEHPTCNGACDGLMPDKVSKGLLFDTVKYE